MYAATCIYHDICVCTCVPVVETDHDSKGDDDDLLDEWLNDVDNCYIATQQVSHECYRKLLHH